ncbi:MAG: response regulator [Lachnospiraceae bacterium]|nr:response regulator [Lachnospiraceae bacterium]
MYEKYSVLFVDDEVNILNSLKRGLIDEEYQCYFASSGREALEILKKTKIGVIVSDMRMPEMDGLKLLREVEVLYPWMVKIVLSGYTQLPQILTTINQVDIFKFITKPWKMEEEFITVIHKALDYYIIREENEEIKTALKNKNQAYTNMLKRIEDSVASAKKSSDILGECGKQILSFQHKLVDHPKESYSHFLVLQEKIYELFCNAVKGEEKEITTEELLDEVVQNMEVVLPVIKVEKAQGFQQKIRLHDKVAVALFRACVYAFKEEFETNEIIIHGAVNHSNKPTISIISPKGTTEFQDMDLKFDFLNAILSPIAEKIMTDINIAPVDGNIICLLEL